MIDAALAAAMTAPTAPGGEPAPAEGFGDLLSQMLSPTGGQELAPADVESVDGAALDILAAAQAAAAAVPVALIATDGVSDVAKSGKTHKDDGAAGVDELPGQAATGKAGSAAWHASAAGRAHASAHSAVVLAAAAQAALAAARQDAAQDTIGEVEPGQGSVAAIQESGQAAAVAAVADAAVADAVLSAAEAVDVVTGAAQDEVALADAAVAAAQAETAPAAATAAERTPAASAAPRGIQNIEQPGLAGENAAAAAATAPQPPVRARRPAERAEPASSVSGIDPGAARAEQAGQAAEVHPAGPPVELFAAGALRRVMEAVEAAEHRPPPNTMAVEIPGEGAEDALRLMVSVRGTVVEVTAQGDRVLPPGWARPLADALAQRGMSLDGFGGQDAAAGRQDAADLTRDGQAGRDGQATRDARAAARRTAMAHRPLQSLSTGNDGALRL